ncbi:unnamed protein product [marine sediment metagenome]|uniref:Uncharacterized protein n=1 Tax=marine sediment metagenome TaxID=412755 RepID=X0XR73_9ZZZZ
MIDTGSYFDDFVQNVKQIFIDNKSALGLRAVYGTDISLIPIYPCVCVDFGPWTEERKELGGNRIELAMTVEITYYHEELNQTTRKEAIDKALHNIAELLRKNISVGGYCRQSSITSGEAGPIPRKTAVIAGGIIIFNGIKDIRVTDVT